MEAIHIFTDGGCSGNPGPGGWAYIIVDNGTEIADSGGEASTTNNRMELNAVIKSLERIHRSEEYKRRRIVVHTDSQYVQKGMSTWIHTWMRNNWKTSNKKPVKNQELWKELIELTHVLSVTWEWVRGHAGHAFNERCDALVQKEIAAL